MGQQYWTAVIVVDDKTFISDHFGSFSSELAYHEVMKTVPSHGKVVALVPGRHAKNSIAYSIQASRPDRNYYIDPYEYFRSGEEQGGFI